MPSKPIPTETSMAQPPDLAAHQACMSIQGDNLAVREGLGDLMAMQPLLHLSKDSRGTLEIVLAEALNNVVEHAYREGPGPIRVCVVHVGPILKVSVYDQGLPMPDGQLPKGNLAPICEGEELPEGGFGWFLIRTLTLDLTYERKGGINHLHFELQA